MPVVLALLAALALAATGLAAAASLRLRSLGEWLLAAYVLAFAEVVALVLVLSAFGAVRRGPLLVAVAVVAVVTGGAWWRLGRPVPIGRATLHRAGESLGAQPVLVLLAVAFGAAAVYLLALVVGTPPNNWDSLSYHLTRAALWRQEGAVGAIEDAYDDRLQSNPPNAEIVLTFLLEVARHERAAGLSQFAAWLTCTVGVGTLSRRIGLSGREAMFGALAFALLPIVVLQGSTTQNDLVVAAPLVAATVFLTDASRLTTLVLAGLATSLAVGTKVTAVFALPILFGVALLAAPGHRLRGVAAVLIGSLAGAYWYLGVNLLREGSLLGDHPGRSLVVVLDPDDNLVSTAARVVDLFELPGAPGRWPFAFVAAAALLAVVLGAVARTWRVDARTAATAAALTVAAVVVLPLGYVAWRVFAKLEDVLGTDDRKLPVRGWPDPWVASDSLTWFGPVGLFVTVGVCVAATTLVRRGRLPRLALVAAFAPLVWFALVSLTLAYDPWQGRFFAYPVALSAALWGLLLRRRPLAWAAATVSVTTVALSFLHFTEKPRQVWEGMSRATVQTISNTALRPSLEFMDASVPADASVGLALGRDGFGFPAFGPRLERRVVLVPRDSGAQDLSVEWIYASRRRARTIDPDCWQRVLDSPGTVVLKRRDSCRAER